MIITFVTIILKEKQQIITFKMKLAKYTDYTIQPEILYTRKKNTIKIDWKCKENKWKKSHNTYTRFIMYTKTNTFNVKKKN